MRLTLLDGMRGHLLIGMLVAHLGFNEGLEVLQWFHHKRLIELYDAEFFIFIAGLLVGYLWQTRYATPALRTRFTLNRLRTIYAWYVISALPYVLFHPAANPNLLAGAVEVLTMARGGWFSDILPIYFVCFVLLVPFATWAALYRPAVVLGVSGAIYLASQLTNLFGFFGFTGAFVAFDIAAWQVLFFASMMIGRRAEAWRDAIARLPPRAVLMAVPGLAALLVFLGHWSWYADPMWAIGSYTTLSVRMGLHPIYLARIAVAIALAALVILRSDAWLAPIHRAAHAYFGLRVLRNVGRYSIQMFALHVYMLAIYSIWVFDQPRPVRMAYALASILAFIAAPNLWVALRDRVPAFARTP